MVTEEPANTNYNLYTLVDSPPDTRENLPDMAASKRLPFLLEMARGGISDADTWSVRCRLLVLEPSMGLEQPYMYR